MGLRVYFAPSYGRTIDVGYHLAMLQLLRVPGLTYEPQTNDALIERSRSIAASRFLRGNWDVLLTLDSDIYFRASDAVRICIQAVEQQALVGGLYVTRDRENCWPTSNWEGTITFGGEIGVDDALHPVKHLANGCMAVPRAVFETLAPTLPLCHEDRPDGGFWPFYECFPTQNKAGKWIFLSEDFALCERAREAGFECYLNPAVRALHLGLHPFSLEDLLQKPLPPQPISITGGTNPETGRPTWHVETVSAPAAPDAPEASSAEKTAALRYAEQLVNSRGEPVARERKGAPPVLVIPAGRGNGRVN